MDAIQISGQWYVVRYDDGEKFTIVDGPSSRAALGRKHGPS